MIIMKKLLLFSLLVLIFLGCRKDVDEVSNTPNIPLAEFNYTTTGNVSVEIDATTSLSGATFELYTANPEDGGKLLSKGMIAENGKFRGSLMLSRAQKSVYLKSTYVGLPGEITIPINRDLAVLDYSTFSGQLSGKRGGNEGTVANTPAPVVVNGIPYAYMGSFNNAGYPSYLTPIADVVDQSLLADINASLPEGSRVPNTNPQFIPQGNAADLQLTDSADVWVTFVHEGAGYRNALGYYVYDVSNPPTSKSQIDTIYTIFPNSSFAGSGGQLSSGDKVWLGSFGAGKAIGWVLFQNAFNTTSVRFNNLNLFSNPDFNPESNANLRQHLAMLYHPTRDLVLLGFEDIARDNPSCDQDFNDAIFYVTTNPIDAIVTSNIPVMNTTSNSNNDSDNDGVLNSSDDYPNDPNRAFDNYVPYEGGFSSIAFEDLWPARGDYDFNDLVMSINYKSITNASGQVTALEYKMFVRHIGASFHNGFGFSLPIPASQVSSVSGTNLTKGLITIDGKGLETGHSNAVVIVFDDAFDNQSDTITLSVNLNSPFSLAALNQQGTNPFIFVDGDRGREVHLIGQEPTSKMNNSYFGQSADVSNPSTGTYFIGSENDPWAIEINDEYVPPLEKVDIRTAYTRFNTWVDTRGGQYPDWYQDKSGYRVKSRLQ
jgi:LruC domain-containing protein